MASDPLCYNEFVLPNFLHQNFHQFWCPKFECSDENFSVKTVNLDKSLKIFTANECCNLIFIAKFINTDYLTSQN